MAEATKDQTADEVADRKANAKLDHSEGGVTTRSDATDAGVPMLPGDPSEPVGPEDALGEGPKRGDYSDRIVGEPHTSVPVEDAKDGKPNTKLVAQRPNASDRGDEKGVKGGVGTA